MGDHASTLVSVEQAAQMAALKKGGNGKTNDKKKVEVLQPPSSTHTFVVVE